MTSVVFNGETLKEGTDYTVSYKDNVNPGTATAIVTGAGDFAGTKSVSFTIEAAPTKEPVVNEPTVTTADIQAVEEVSGATTVVLGPKVKKIEAGAFAGTDVTTVIVKTKKLKKSTVKNAFKGSKVKTVKVKIKDLKSTKGLKGKALKEAKKYNKEAKAYNKKIAKKYKKFMTKKIVGKKVTVKA